MTTIPFDVFQPRVVFLDDDPQFLETVQAANLNAVTTVTTDVKETLHLVEAKEVDYVVSDMNMPGQDGVHVLERAHSVNPDVGLALLTGFEPTAEQKRVLARIKADVYYKGAELLQLLTDIEGQALARYVDQRDAVAITQEISTLRQRLALLEELHVAWTADLVDQLAAIPNPEKRIVSTEEGPMSILDLIEDIQKLRPRGVHHIRLWLRGKRTVREARR
jgi:two-component system, response regulator, stage 0 sporulation protein F